VTLLAFAAERRAAAPLLVGARGACRVRCVPPLSTDIACPQDAQQQTRRKPLVLSIDGTDRRTDGHTPSLHIDPAAHTMRVESVIYDCTTTALEVR